MQVGEVGIGPGRIRLECDPAPVPRKENDDLRALTRSPCTWASMCSSVSARPSAKCSWSRLGLKSSKGSTAMDSMASPTAAIYVTATRITFPLSSYILTRCSRALRHPCMLGYPGLYFVTSRSNESNPAHMHELTTIARALDNESRLRILMSLQAGELCLCQLIELLGLAPSTVSKHVELLRVAGLVDRRKDGRWH